MKEFGGRISIFCDLKVQSVLTSFPKKLVYLFSNARSEQNIELKKKVYFYTNTIYTASWFLDNEEWNLH